MTNSLYDLAVDRHASRWATFYASLDTLLKQRPTRPTTSIAGDEPPVLREHHKHGLQSVPIYKIITIAPRFGLFDYLLQPNTTAPLAFAAVERHTAVAQDEIELYKVGNIYLVKDGNQRVALARVRGQLFLPANVTEYVFELPQNEHARLYELLLREEQCAFFEATNLDRLYPEQQIECLMLGNYQLLQRQIDTYQPESAAPSSPAERTMNWYDTQYMPVINSIRKQGFGAYLPNQSETDLYLWATERATQDQHRSIASRFAVLKRLATLHRAMRRTPIFNQTPK